MMAVEEGVNVEAVTRDLSAFIEDAATTRRMVQTARALHRRSPSFMGVSKCARDAEVWPCATITALGGPEPTT